MARIKPGVADKAASKLAKQEGMHAMGNPPGLYLCVAGGGRSWILRYSFGGARRDLGLGSYFDLTLAEARDKARENRKLVLQGIDPIEAKREKRDALSVERSKRMTFSKCVDGYLDAHGDAWRNPKHRAQWQSTLETYAYPVIGGMNVAAVDSPLVLKILEPIWKTKTETAKRLRGRIENVLDWAKVRGYRAGDNPAKWRGHLDHMLAKPSKVSAVEHHAALAFAEMGSFMAQVRAMEGIAARALEFTILTACRSGEVRGATWAEFDLPARLWIIPAKRMKAEREHRVPLSDSAISILAKMQEHQLGDFVFPGMKENMPISNMSMGAVLKRMGRGDLTVHGFRSAFRDWVSESTAYPRDVAEMSLAHTIANKVEAAYRRGDLYDKRVRLMADWAKYCSKPMQAGAVLPMKRKAAK